MQHRCQRITRPLTGARPQRTRGACIRASMQHWDLPCTAMQRRHPKPQPASSRPSSSGRSSDAPEAREVVLPGAVWLLADDEPDVPVYGPGRNGFVMRGLAALAWQPPLGLAPLASRPGGLAVHAAMQPLAVLPASTCTGIVPYLQPAGSQAHASAAPAAAAAAAPTCTGIVPYEGGWLSGGDLPDVQVASGDDMMGVVLGAGLSTRRDAPLAQVGAWPCFALVCEARMKLTNPAAGETNGSAGLAMRRAGARR